MGTKRSTALIVNHNGLGNGILTLPLLQRLEEAWPSLDYYHIDNPVLNISPFTGSLGLNRLKGLVPPLWRRFSEPDHEDILQFIAEHKVDIIINLRNELPEYDTGYAQFKEKAPDGLQFWDMDFDAIRRRPVLRHCVHEQLDIFEQRGLDMNGIRWQWMRDHFTPAGPHADNAVGFFICASQDNKMWPEFNWIALGHDVLEYSDASLVLFSGSRPEEQSLAARLAQTLNQVFPHRCQVSHDESFYDFCSSLSRVSLLVSNDSVGVHAAAALDVPVLGLYFSTFAEVWGGMSDRFFYLQSDLGLHCPFQKTVSGNCLYYYGGCPAPCKYVISADSAFRKIQPWLKELFSKPVLTTYETQKTQSSDRRYRRPY